MTSEQPSSNAEVAREIVHKLETLPHIYIKQEPGTWGCKPGFEELAMEAITAALDAKDREPAKTASMDNETIRTLLDLLNPLHGELDRQTYDERHKQNFDAPANAEYNVDITAQMERDLTQAVLILEDRHREPAKAPVARRIAPPDEGLGPPVRAFKDTFSAQTVVKEMFFPDAEPVAQPDESPPMWQCHTAALEDCELASVAQPAERIAERPSKPPTAWSIAMQAGSWFDRKDLTLVEREVAVAKIVSDAISAEREAAERKCAEFEAALQPFAQQAGRYDPPENDGHQEAWDSSFKIDELRRADVALAGGTPHLDKLLADKDAKIAELEADVQAVTAQRDEWEAIALGFVPSGIRSLSPQEG